jgi:multidrug efflux system membrane fusion protein
MDGSSVVDAGLAAGTHIVVSGQYRLQPGSRVQTNVAATDSAGGN